VNALFAGLAAHRRANKRRASQAERDAAVEAGNAFVVEGVVSKTTGELVIYANEEKAFKAALRQVCKLRKLGEWWQLPDKGASITPDAKALVHPL
jgi:hypothetical protein